MVSYHIDRRKSGDGGTVEETQKLFDLHKYDLQRSLPWI